MSRGRSLRSRCALLVVLSLAAPVPAAAEPSGVIEGEVRVLTRSLFGAATPADDHSGVVVYLTGFTTAAPAEPAELVQRGERFRPRILPIVAGQTVSFPNRDRIYHNVFSVSPLHPFDLGQYKGSDPTKSVAFERPGLVPVYCNIHPRMIAYVVVLENDAFALSDEAGRFQILRVPPGRHALHAWRPGAERVSRDVEVRAGDVARLSLELSAGRIPAHKRKDGSDYPRPGFEAER
jgi:plastocyanin